jgi:hypothetical protein
LALRTKALALRVVGALSSTDERVGGHVPEVTQALRKSSEWSRRVIYTYSRDNLNANRPRLDLLWTGFVSAAARAKHENFVMSA